MIFLTGASGTFGHHVASELIKQNMPFRAAAQSVEAIYEKLGNQVEAVAFDWNQPQTIPQLLKGIQVVYLISPPFTYDFHRQAAPLLEEAKRQGVQHIVLTTGLFTEGRPDNLFYKTEELVKQSGIDYTLIRPDFLFQNFINYDLQAVQGGALYLPSGDGKAAYVDVRDVAALSAQVLAQPQEHAGKSYAATGPQALSHREMAAVFTTILGRTVQHIDPSIAEYTQTLRGYGVPDLVSGFMAMLYTTMKDGEWSKLSHDVETVTGQPARSLAEFVEENKAVFN